MNGIDIWIFRNFHNMTQKDLANILGVSKSLISHMESGGKISIRTKKQLNVLIENIKLRKEHIELSIKKGSNND